MKKFVASIITFAVLLSLCSVSTLAASTENDLGIIMNTKSNNAVYITKTAAYDFRKIPSKSFTPSTINNTMRAAGDPHYTANCDFNNFLGTTIKAWSDSWTDDTKSSKFSIDRIMAKARLYKDDALYSSATDDNNDSSHAGASISKTPATLWGCELYGSHAFELKGYQSWYPETYDGDW